jgi:anti-sigma regulatory factor (Ser/Thr protein kinase)
VFATGDTLRIDSANADDIEHLHPWFDTVSGRLPPGVRHGMRVALEEVVLNAAMHGTGPNSSGRITVQLRITPDFVELCVESFGREFDPTRAPTRPRPASILEAHPGGLGLVLLHHYCHDITYERIQNRNRLIMRFPSPME